MHSFSKPNLVGDDELAVLLNQVAPLQNVTELPGKLSVELLNTERHQSLRPISHSTPQPLHLCRGDSNRNLSPRSGQKLLIRSDDLGSLIQATILCQDVEEVLGQLGVFALRQDGFDAFELGVAVSEGGFEEGAEFGVPLEEVLDLCEVGFDGIEGILFGGGGEESRGVTTVNSVKAQGNLVSEVRLHPVDRVVS